MDRGTVDLIFRVSLCDFRLRLFSDRLDWYGLIKRVSGPLNVNLDIAGCLSIGLYGSGNLETLRVGRRQHRLPTTDPANSSQKLSPRNAKHWMSKGKYWMTVA